MMTARQIAVIRQQLQGFVEEFAEDLGRSERRHWCGKDLEGLLREGERKSIEPPAVRVGAGPLHLSALSDPLYPLRDHPRFFVAFT